MTKLVSLDTSTTNSGYAMYKDGILSDYGSFDYRKIKDIDIRTKKMCTSLLSYLSENKPDIICIEQPKGAGRNVELVRKLAKILGVVYCWALLNASDYEEIMPSVWRKYIPEFNQGKKDREELKAESLRVVKEKYDIEADSDDVSDAILIGQSYINKFDDEDLFD